MNIPKTTFIHSQKTEAIRLVHIGWQLQQHFYQSKGFHLLPYPLEKAAVVYLPDLPSIHQPEFWQRAKGFSAVQNWPEISFPESLLNELPKSYLDYSHIFKEWQKVEYTFWEKVRGIFPNIFSDVEEIEILPTQYGSVSTALSTLFSTNDKITVFIRGDADISHIFEAMLIDRFRKKEPMKSLNWEEQESTMDFIISQTSFASLFPGYRNTLASLRKKQRAKIAHDSQDYLASLGVLKGGTFHIHEDRIFSNGTPLHLSLHETAVLKHLIQNKNTLISFDSIADVLWQNTAYENFSLEAITKCVERLRKKILKHGIFSEVIQTQKGQGYILID